MAWMYADWINAVDTQPITGVNQTSKTFTVDGDHRASACVGLPMVVTASTGNDGTYPITKIEYEIDKTTFTTSTDIPDATIDGDLTLPKNNAAQLEALRNHIAEVSAAMGPNVAADGVSRSVGSLQTYLDRLMKQEDALDPSNCGVIKTRVLRYGNNG